MVKKNLRMIQDFKDEDLYVNSKHNYKLVMEQM